MSVLAPAEQLLSGSSPLTPPAPSGVRGLFHCPDWLHKTRLFGIDGGDLRDSCHLDHSFGVLPQLQVPQGGVQQVPDHLIVDLMGQVGDPCQWETKGRRSRQGSGSPFLPSEKGTGAHRPLPVCGMEVKTSASTGECQAARAKDARQQSQVGLPLRPGWALGRGRGPD